MLTLVAGLLPTATVPAIALGGAASRFMARGLRLVAAGVRGVAIGERQRLAVAFSIWRSKGRSPLSHSEMARPEAPARAVRPMRWT